MAVSTSLQGFRIHAIYMAVHFVWSIYLYVGWHVRVQALLFLRCFTGPTDELMCITFYLQPMTAVPEVVL